MSSRLRAWLVVLPLVLVTVACGKSADEGLGLDQEYRPTPGERDVQFTGATKLRMGGTLAVPVGATAPVPVVLIVPAPGPVNRDGPLVLRPPDPLYKDLSAAFTGAGMATFRYDHRGIGESQLASGEQLRWEDMVDDARQALTFVAERREVDASRIAVLGHDMAGAIALKLAATDARVKSVALLSVPGRPLVDVLSDGFRAFGGQATADGFRAIIDHLLANGALPPRQAIAPEYQTGLPPGQDEFFKSLYSTDTLADAPAVKVPVLVVLGERSTQVSSLDAERLTRALGGRSEVLVAPNSSATLQQVLPTPVRPFDPTNMDNHGLGPPVADAPREKGTVERITSFLGASLQARPA